MTEKVSDERLAEMLAEGPGMVWIAADEDELFSALTELVELRKAVKPFAALGQYMIDEGFVTKPDDAAAWGFDRHDLTYGDFRRAAAALTGAMR